jgi:hypothetical protein
MIAFPTKNNEIDIEWAEINLNLILSKHRMLKNFIKISEK